MAADILADTSVWVDFFRNKTLPSSQTLSRLLDADRICLTGIVTTELLRGARNQKDMDSIRGLLSPLPLLTVNDQTWIEAGESAFRLAKKGMTIFTVDAVIATVAMQHDVSLFTKDKHFVSTATHLPLKLFVP